MYRLHITDTETIWLLDVSEPRINQLQACLTYRLTVTVTR